MIEIVKGTVEEKIIRILQNNYPVTIADVKRKTGLSKRKIERHLKKLQTKKVVELEPLPGKTYIRLLTNNFHFIGERHQRKPIKHYKEKPKSKPKSKSKDDIMYQ